jgi:hypothetical protein
LRGFETLQHITLDYPRGGEFGDGMRFFHNLPKEATARYVLKLIDDNPLRDFDFESG